jgi:autotransporter-associated beta strand protein
MTVPNNPADVATFATSSSTGVFLGVSEQVGSIVFSAGASAFTITDNAGTLIISGGGVINDSGVAQNFVNLPNERLGIDAEIFFNNSASAGNAIYTNYGRPFEFVPTGATVFNVASTAASATFYNYAGTAGSGHVTFNGATTAADATFYNYPANQLTFGSDHGYTEFYGVSTAADATFVCYGGNQANVFGIATGGAVTFADISTAANATFDLRGGTTAQTSGGTLTFNGSATADYATITADAGTGGGLGAAVSFLGQSDGYGAQLVIDGTLDVSGHDWPGVATGSLAGSGTVTLGYNYLALQLPGPVTTFSGVIQDGPMAGGSLTLAGARLELTGANTYTGGTTIIVGALIANNTTGSATGPGPVTVPDGTLAGQGTISGPVTLGTASGVGPFLSPGRKVVRAIGNLTALGGVTFAANSTYYCEVRQRAADRLTTAGVTINPGAQFELILLPPAPPPAGTVLEVISNTSAQPIAGTFANLADGAILRVKRVKFQASYTGGDGNDLTLTVVP